MLKTVSVYCNGDDCAVLERVRQEFGFKSNSAAYKEALKRLSTDPSGAAPAKESSDLRVEVPPYVRLRSMIKDCIGECRKENAIVDDFVRKNANSPEHAAELRAKIMAGVRKKEAAKH